MTKNFDVREMVKILLGLEAREKGPGEPYPSQSTTLGENEARYPGLVPYETRGRFKFLNKYSQMKANYRASINTAKENYDALPFGPQTRAAFKAGMNAEPDKAFNDKLIVSHEKKWANKWMKGVSR